MYVYVSVVLCLDQVFVCGTVTVCGVEVGLSSYLLVCHLVVMTVPQVKLSHFFPQPLQFMSPNFAGIFC
jgi:hypothetical protein